MDRKTFYITTPIYYPSDKLHIGNSYTTVAADTISRYKRMRGYDVMFLTGTDEHGQKIENKAVEKGVTPIEFVDDIVDGIKKLWKLMDISYDDYLRTTEDRHKKVVKKIFNRLYEQGDIYKGEYEGLYCTPCESFWTKLQLVDGKCPDCGRGVETVKEESYFLRMSKYQDRLLKHIEDNPDFIQPQTRQNEMINNFLKPGLNDLCVSRTSFDWGIPVDFDPEHVIYVWIDALSNYITALGYESDDDSKFKKYWPCDVHLVGKDILRFHTIIWPIMLMALDIPLPKQVYAHGWLKLNGGRMAKSTGNVIDPVMLVERYGLDAIRYYLLREITFGADGDFSNEALVNRINADLANDLGNLLSRTVAMIGKYFDGVMPASDELGEFEIDLRNVAAETVKNVEINTDKMFFSNALNDIWIYVRRTNKYIDQTLPWILARDEANKGRLGTVLYHLAEALRQIAVLISPFMTKSPVIIREQLGIEDDSLSKWESLSKFGLLKAGCIVKKGALLFPRLDLKVEMDFMEEYKKSMMPKTEKAVVQKESKPEITIDDFNEMDLRTATVLSAEKLKKSNNLLVLKLKVGDEERQVVSGIANHYEPENLIGKQVVIVYNLKPVKLRGKLSEGMILCAKDSDGNLMIVNPDGDIADGSDVN